MRNIGRTILLKCILLAGIGSTWAADDMKPGAMMNEASMPSGVPADMQQQDMKGTTMKPSSPAKDGRSMQMKDGKPMARPDAMKPAEPA